VIASSSVRHCGTALPGLDLSKLSRGDLNNLGLDDAGQFQTSGGFAVTSRPVVERRRAYHDDGDARSYALFHQYRRDAQDADWDDLEYRLPQELARCLLSGSLVTRGCSSCRDSSEQGLGKLMIEAIDFRDHLC